GGGRRQPTRSSPGHAASHRTGAPDIGSDAAVKLRVPVLATLALLLAGTEAAGQVTTLHNLAFGTITSGTTTSVGKTTANAAQWRIHVPVALVGFQLTLPASLTGPGSAIPVTFSGTDGVYRGNNS